MHAYVHDSFIYKYTWYQNHPNECDWIWKMWSIFTMEHYLAIRKDKMFPFVPMWMEFERPMLSDLIYIMLRKQRKELTSVEERQTLRLITEVKFQEAVCMVVGGVWAKGI